jgi:hypothetical protein
MRTFAAALSTIALLWAAGPPDACAAGQRSFVSGSGVDVGTCTLTAPCRSFGYAIGQTTAGGEVLVLDSAGYGPVTVTKAITIAAPPGIYAGISVLSSGDGVTVIAGATDVVVLRGLTINGLNAGLGRGVIAFNAGLVHVDRCAISGFLLGIDYDGTSVDAMLISDSELRSNLTGIYATGGGTVGLLEVARTRVHGSTADGMRLDSIRRATISDSFIGRNQDGIIVTISAASSNTSLAIERTTIVDNPGVGLYASSNAVPVSVVNIVQSTVAGNGIGIATVVGGYVRVAGTQINGNGTGVSWSGGTIVTLGTNMLYGNGANGTFTGSLSPN